VMQVGNQMRLRLSAEQQASLAVVVPALPRGEDGLLLPLESVAAR
jgi:hypothetical protein